MAKFCEGLCSNCDCKNKVNLSKQTKSSQQARIDNLERALFTLKKIAQGYGSDPRIYAQNTLHDINEKY